MKNLVLTDIDLNKEISKCESMEDLVGKNALMQRLFGNVIQQFLEAEMEDHLGRAKYDREPKMIKIIEMAIRLKILKPVLVMLKLISLEIVDRNLNLKLLKSIKLYAMNLIKKLLGFMQEVCL